MADIESKREQVVVRLPEGKGEFVMNRIDLKALARASRMVKKYMQRTDPAPDINSGGFGICGRNIFSLIKAD